MAAKKASLPNWIWTGAHALDGTAYTARMDKVSRNVLQKKLKPFSYLGPWEVIQTKRHGTMAFIRKHLVRNSN